MMGTVVAQGLDGAVVLVTGARGGIGQAICVALKDAGAKVVATGRGEASAALEGIPWLNHDVTSPEDWMHVSGEISRQFGRLDCLVNNAGICVIERIADTSLEQWRRVFSANVESVLLGLQASLDLLRESGRTRPGGSSVVNVSSVAGTRGVALASAYSASKGAVTLLSRSVAKEFAGLRYPIRVNCVSPGSVDTPMMGGALARLTESGLASSAQECRAAVSAQIPLGRFAQAEEIASSVVFLCSTAASFITGSDLVIDGGAIA